jgi:hypothetical protein
MELSKKKGKLALILKCLASGLFDDEETEYLVIRGNMLSPDPNWTGYLFWSDRYGLDGSIEAAVEKAFAYKPIILGPPPSEKPD